MGPIQSTQANFSKEQNTGLKKTGVKRPATTYITAPESKCGKKDEDTNIKNRSSSRYYQELANSIPEIYRNMTKQGSTQG